MTWLFLVQLLGVFCCGALAGIGGTLVLAELRS